MALDIEKRFIACLLSSKRSAQEAYFAKQIPSSVFRIRTQEIVWVNRFRDKYGVYPSREDFRAKFHFKLPEIKSPIYAVLQPVLDRSMFEQMCRVQDQTKTLIDKGEDIAGALAVYKAEAHKLTDYSTDYEDIDIIDDDGADARYRKMVEEKASGKQRILDTPWRSLNRALHHMNFGETVAISARYSLGKSWVVVEWAHYLASKGFRVGIFSKEMPGQQFQDRIECRRYKVNYPDYREGDLSPKELRDWRRRRYKDKCNRPDYFLKVFGNESDEGMGFGQIIAKVKQYNLEVVFFDGAYLNRPKELRADVGDVQRFTYNSNRTKQYAKMLGVLWFNTLQDNRSAEDKKGNTKGGATTVYGSDAWGQDSDWLIQIDGRRGAKERGLSLNKGRESDLAEFKISFQLAPFPRFEDLGPKPQNHVEAKMKKKNEFTGVQ